MLTLKLSNFKGEYTGGDMAKGLNTVIGDPIARIGLDALNPKSFSAIEKNESMKQTKARRI